jgi:uncharacterized protein YodC (DUF2158 family)
MQALKVVSITEAPAKPRLKWKVGQEVNLRSGGPVMTIEQPGETHSECVWFTDEGNEVCTGKFLNATLTKHIPKPESKKA